MEDEITPIWHSCKMRRRKQRSTEWDKSILSSEVLRSSFLAVSYMQYLRIIKGMASRRNSSIAQIRDRFPPNLSQVPPSIFITLGRAPYSRETLLSKLFLLAPGWEIQCALRVTPLHSLSTSLRLELQRIWERADCKL